MKPLLTLIDFQIAFVSTPGIEPPIEAVIDRAALLLSGFRELGLPIAHIRTATSRPTARLKRGSGLKPRVDSPEYQPPLRLAENSGEWVVHKTGYSGFRGTNLDEILGQHEVDTLLVAGVYSHACVRQTALDAREAGREVWVVDDAIASDAPLDAAITRRYLEDRSVHFAPVAELLKRLAGVRSSAESQPATRVQAAVTRAVDFAPAWRDWERAARAELLGKLSNRLAGSATSLAKCITDELGKPVRFSEVEVRRTGEMLAAVAARFLSESEEIEAAGARVRRRPHGTIAVITPFNNPIYLALSKIAPAVLYGNTVVWKPAPETSRVSQCLMDLLQESDWPGGLVSLLQGDSSVGRALLDDPMIDAITITGSSAAGFSAQAAAAQRRVPLQAELGGNNASVVWHDADLKDAATRVAAGAFDQSGQRCTANRRVVVHRSVKTQFLELLLEATRALAWGDPSEPATRIGPLVSASRRQFVAGMVDRAERLLGPCYRPHIERPFKDVESADRWFPPTIICCDDPQHEIVQEETFGPVLLVQSASDWRQAIELCNGVRQGLAAAIFTRSPERVGQFLDEARAGILKINQSTADAAVDAPFGGWKASGLGPPEHGVFDVEFFTRPQTVYGHTFETSTDGREVE